MAKKDKKKDDSLRGLRGGILGRTAEKRYSRSNDALKEIQKNRRKKKK